MRPYLEQVKGAAKKFLLDVPSVAKCSILSFNRLLQTHAGGSLTYVNYGGNTYDGRVHDVAPEGRDTAFEKLYPEAITDRDDTGNAAKFEEIVSAGKWGIPCQDGVPYIQKITARGGTDLYLPLLLTLRAAAVSQRTLKEEQVYHHIIVLITDGGNQDGHVSNKTEILELKKKTGAKVFVYWIGKGTDSSSLEGLVDYEMTDEGQSAAALDEYLSSINVFLDDQQVITLPHS